MGPRIMAKPSPLNKNEIALGMAAYMGPLPPSIELKKYDEICPGAGETIIANFINESNHRRDIEKRDLNFEAHITDKLTKHYAVGLWLGFASVVLVLGVGIWFMIAGHPTQGAGIICTAVVGIGACFIYGSRGLEAKHKDEKK